LFPACFCSWPAKPSRLPQPCPLLEHQPRPIGHSAQLPSAFIVSLPPGPARQSLPSPVFKQEEEPGGGAQRARADRSIPQRPSTPLAPNRERPVPCWPARIRSDPAQILRPRWHPVPSPDARTVTRGRDARDTRYGMLALSSGCVHFAKSSWKVTVALFVVIW
jgi:hypothetical protein